MVQVSGRETIYSRRGRSGGVGGRVWGEGVAEDVGGRYVDGAKGELCNLGWAEERLQGEERTSSGQQERRDSRLGARTAAGGRRVWPGCEGGLTGAATARKIMGEI